MVIDYIKVTQWIAGSICVFSKLNNGNLIMQTHHNVFVGSICVFSKWNIKNIDNKYL